jgi:hypothetical protein
VSEGVRACVRASLAMDSCRTPPTPPLGTRLTTSALLLEAFPLYIYIYMRRGEDFVHTHTQTHTYMYA